MPEKATDRMLTIHVFCTDERCGDGKDQCPQFSIGGCCDVFGPLDRAEPARPQRPMGYPGTRPKEYTDTFGHEYRRHEDCLEGEAKP